MKATVYYPRRNRPGEWQAVDSAYSARLIAAAVPPLIRALESDDDGRLLELLPGEDGPASLWIGDSLHGVKLDPDDRLDGWTRTLSADEAADLEGARVLVATTPDDLKGALLVFELENETDLSGMGLYSSDLAALLTASDETLHGSEWMPEDRRRAFSILCSRARAEAAYATERVRRLEKRASSLAVKNYVMEATK
jgi:hypothetical protein